MSVMLKVGLYPLAVRKSKIAVNALRMEMPLMAGLNQRDKYWRTITQRLEINNELDDS